MFHKPLFTLSTAFLLVLSLNTATLSQNVPAVGTSDPHTAAIEKLLTLSKFETTTQKMFQESFKLPDDVVKQMGPEDKKKFESMQKILKDKFPEILKDIKPEVVKVYKAALTQEDVDAQIKFYETPAGKKVLEKTPDITLKVNEKVTEVMNKKLIPLLEKEIGTSK
jgi:uncharacterized protein